MHEKFCKKIANSRVNSHNKPCLAFLLFWWFSQNVVTSAALHWRPGPPMLWLEWLWASARLAALLYGINLDVCHVTRPDGSNFYWFTGCHFSVYCLCLSVERSYLTVQTQLFDMNYVTFVTKYGDFNTRINTRICKIFANFLVHNAWN